MIEIIKYLPKINEHESQIKDLLDNYTYHIKSDPKKHFDPIFNKELFVIKSKEISDEVDMILVSFSYALQMVNSDNKFLKRLAEHVVDIKQHIKVTVKG